MTEDRWREALRGFECRACVEEKKQDLNTYEYNGCEHTDFEKDWGIPFQLRSHKESK